MTVERALRTMAGVFVLLSLGLGHWVHPGFFLFTAFVGANLLQSGFTNACPGMESSATMKDAPVAVVMVAAFGSRFHGKCGPVWECLSERCPGRAGRRAKKPQARRPRTAGSECGH